MGRNNLTRFGILILLGLAAASLGGNADVKAASGNDADALAAGKELFTREWLHGDKRSFAGDGLGPVFNARSCVACHRQGGTGGAGPKESNATLVSVFVTRGFEGTFITGAISLPDAAQAAALKQPDRTKLVALHPALRTSASFPLHRFGTGKEFLKWKNQIVVGRFGQSTDRDVSGLEAHTDLILKQDFVTSFRGAESTHKIDGVDMALIPSQRNPPALFGAGLIDRIPDRVLEELALEQARTAKARPHEDSSNKNRLTRHLGFSGVSPETQGPLPITGRVARLKDGRVGRFGWKASVATVREFTLQACSSELGLEVPEFPRAVPPWQKDYKAPGLDLSSEQCDQLIHFVASLPRPVNRAPETRQHGEEIVAGQKLFTSVGCATCHRPKLGDVDGIYSDLLLHDMGQLLSDSGSYSTNIAAEPTASSPDPLPVQVRLEARTTKEAPPKFGANTREWRTPPLWGLRDSAPYLHDGRADTIEDAVTLHGGEGYLSAEAFFNLKPDERQKIELFLQSLAAPKE